MQTPIDTLKSKVSATSQSAVARELNVTRQLISQILLGQCGISDEMALKLGYEKVYRRKRA